MWISEFSISRGQLWPSGLCGWSNNCVMIWLKLQLTSAADAAGWLMLCVDLQLAGGEESSCPCEDYLSITHRHRCWGDLGGRGAQTKEKKVLSAKPHKSLRRCHGQGGSPRWSSLFKLASSHTLEVQKHHLPCWGFTCARFNRCVILMFHS